MNPPPLNPRRLNTTSAIQVSLRAFVCGFFSLVPVFGIIPGTYVYLCWKRMRSQFHPEWNPAQPYLVMALLLSISGLLITVLAISVVVYKAVNSLAVWE